TALSKPGVRRRPRLLRWTADGVGTSAGRTVTEGQAAPARRARVPASFRRSADDGLDWTPSGGACQLPTSSPPGFLPVPLPRRSSLDKWPLVHGSAGATPGRSAPPLHLAATRSEPPPPSHPGRTLAGPALRAEARRGRTLRGPRQAPAARPTVAANPACQH